MAGKVFFSVTMSLDGFIAPEERMDDPDMQRWTAHDTRRAADARVRQQHQH